MGMNLPRFISIVALLQRSLSLQMDGSVSPVELQCSGKEVLSLVTLVPCADSSLQCCSGLDRGLAISPALDLAIEQINYRSYLLPCHKLELLYKETGCNSIPETVVGLTSGLFQEDGSKVVGILGPVCSMDSKVVSTLTNRPDLELVVVHNSGLSLLGNRTMFPHSIGILGSSQSLVDLSVALLDESGWKNIAVLYESTNLFYRSTKTQFLTSVGSRINIRYVSGVTTHFYPLSDVWSSKARIVFVFASPKHLTRMVCLAYHMEMVYPSYQWVLVGHHFSELTSKPVSVNYQGNKFNCSTATLAKIAFNRTFLITYQLLTNNQDLYVLRLLNLTVNDFLNLYHERLGAYNKTFCIDTSLTLWSYSMYDAVWAWAIVLDKVLSNHSNITIDSLYNFHHGKKIWVKAILDEFYSIDFQGLSGHIKFNSTTGFLNRPSSIIFVNSGNGIQLGGKNIGGGVVSLEHVETIPDLIRVVVLPYKGIVVVFLAIQCLVFFSVVVLHATTLLYRNTKYIKASSPKLIQVAFLGGYMVVVAMFMYTVFFIKEHSITEGTIICRVVWMWLMPLSFTLPLGIVILRTWRLYRIFKHYLNPGRFISNPALLTILLGMLLIDIFFAVVWTAVGPMQFELINKRGITNELVLEQSCEDKYVYVWVGLGYSYKITLLWIMVVLAFLTKNIPNQTFATNSLRVFSYLTTTLVMIGFSHYYFLLWFTDDSTNDFITLCVLLITLAVIFLLFVIIPPILPLLQGGKFITRFSSHS